MQRSRDPILHGTVTLLLVLVNILSFGVVSAAESSVTTNPANQKTGILWKVPTWLKPNTQLSHPRVQYTLDGLQQAKKQIATNVLWARSVYDGFVSQADTFQFSDQQIRNFMPPQYSYFKYTDTMTPCPDGSPMTASWDKPGKVMCGKNIYPDATHPDNGKGWRDSSGQTHYFVARWNGFVVEKLTGSLMSQAFAYALGGKVKYAHTAAVILDALATIYPTTIEGPLDYPGLRPGSEGGRLERPYFQVARVLLTYANAADLIWSSPELDNPSPTNPTLSIRDNITYNLLLNGADYCYREAHRRGYVDSLNNGTADYNKAILAVGSLLGIDEYVDWVINGPTSLQNMITNNIDRDGLYYETTAGYTNVVRGLYLQIADMLYNLRTPRYPQGVNYYDDPRFAQLYVGSRERLFVAGRSPSYGDTDPDRATAVSKPIDEAAARQILQFAVRASDSETRQRYWTLVAEGASGLVATSIQSDWGLFNVDKVPANLAAPKRNMAGNEVLGGKGMTLLRSGTDRGAFIRYGATLAHGGRDELGLNLYTHGREMAFDPGYGMAHYREGWNHQTVSHLATVVNEISQQGSGGSLLFTASAPGLGVTEATDPGAYAHQGVSVYQRLVSLVDSTDNESYLIDIFRVKGGRQRDYSFHSWSTKFATSGLEFGPTQKGSVASPSYTWHNQIGVDEKIIPYRNQDFGWSAPPGNGYGFMGNPSKASGEKAWNATWDNADRRLKLFMLPAQGREIVVADAPSPMGGTKYLLAREKGNTPSQFVSVVDMTTTDFQVAKVDELAITKATEGDFAPVAFSVTLANAKPQVNDIILSTVSGSFTARSADLEYTTDAAFASVRQQGSSVQNMHVVKGTYLQAGNMQLAGFPVAYNGTITAVDYEAGSILVSTPNLPLGVVGAYALISAPEYSHNSPYQINRVEKADSGTRLYLAPGTFELGKGSVSGAPSGKYLPNMTNLPYSSVIYRSTEQDYFKGKAVVNERGSQAVIERVESDHAGLVVNNTTGFAADDNLTVYDIKVGDTVSIPVAVHLTQLSALQYELKSPQPVWLSITDKADMYVYVTDEKGEFTLAQSELRAGVRWFLVTPGKVILQRAGQILSDASVTISDNATAEVKVNLAELATKAPISGAKVTTQLEERILEFAETAPGVYTGKVPQGTKVGTYNLMLNAEKAGLVFEPLPVKWTLQSQWSVSAPEAVDINLGATGEIEVKLAGVNSSDVVVIAYLAEQKLSTEPKSSSAIVVKVPPITVEQSVTVQLVKIGGFRQEKLVLLRPAGGRIVPLAQKVTVKADQEIEIKVKFVLSNGTVLTGEAIPYSQAFLGFMFSSVFSDPDGDGVAVATMSRMVPGNYTVTLWADGCDAAEVSVTVVP